MEKEDPCLGPAAATFDILPDPCKATHESQERGSRDGVCRNQHELMCRFCSSSILLLYPQQGAFSSIVTINKVVDLVVFFPMVPVFSI
jgi:hypothetical protein